MPRETPTLTPAQKRTILGGPPIPLADQRTIAARDLSSWMIHHTHVLSGGQKVAILDLAMAIKNGTPFTITRI